MFIAALLIINKRWKAFHMPSSRQLDKQNVTCTSNERLFRLKGKGILTHATT
jgi:hypothetical protein